MYSLSHDKYHNQTVLVNFKRILYLLTELVLLALAWKAHSKCDIFNAAGDGKKYESA